MMRIAIGNDHAGYEMKLHLIEQLRQAAYDVTDFGTHSTESVDYPDYAAAVAAAILDDQVDRGIVVCGTGVGVAIAANKIKGIRAAQASDIYTAPPIRSSSSSPRLATVLRSDTPLTRRSPESRSRTIRLRSKETSTCTRSSG